MNPICNSTRQDNNRVALLEGTFNSTSCDLSNRENEDYFLYLHYSILKMHKFLPNMPFKIWSIENKRFSLHAPMNKGLLNQISAKIDMDMLNKFKPDAIRSLHASFIQKLVNVGMEEQPNCVQFLTLNDTKNFMSSIELYDLSLIADNLLEYMKNDKTNDKSSKYMHLYIHTVIEHFEFKNFISSYKYWIRLLLRDRPEKPKNAKKRKLSKSVDQNNKSNTRDASVVSLDSLFNETIVTIQDAPRKIIITILRSFMARENKYRMMHQFGTEDISLLTYKNMIDYFKLGEVELKCMHDNFVERDFM